MKLRIAAIIAIVVLLCSIAAYWLDLRDHPQVEHPQPPSIAEPAKVTQDVPPVVHPSGPTPSSTGIPNTPAGPAAPLNVAKVGSPKGNFPPIPAPKQSKPPVPDVRSPTPTVPTKTELPRDPDVSAKAAVELDKVGLMLRDYRTRMGENPTGTNAEIMKAVMGGNPKKARLGPPEGQQINGNGELVDRWGTPYFFHQMSKTDMEIRSAGPDQQLWTADDIVGR